MDKKLIFTLAIAGTLLAAVLINLGLLYIAKGRSRSTGYTKKILKSTIIGLKDPWKEDNESLKELSELVKAIKEKEKSRPDTNDL